MSTGSGRIDPEFIFLVQIKMYIERTFVRHLFSSRYVEAEPSWAKQLEGEMTLGRKRVTFRFLPLLLLLFHILLFLLVILIIIMEGMRTSGSSSSTNLSLSYSSSSSPPPSSSSSSWKEEGLHFPPQVHLLLQQQAYQSTWPLSLSTIFFIEAHYCSFDSNDQQ